MTSPVPRLVLVLAHVLLLLPLPSTGSRTSRASDTEDERELRALLEADRLDPGDFLTQAEIAFILIRMGGARRLRDAAERLDGMDRAPPPARRQWCDPLARALRTAASGDLGPAMDMLRRLLSQLALQGMRAPGVRPNAEALDE